MSQPGILGGCGPDLGHEELPKMPSVRWWLVCCPFPGDARPPPTQGALTHPQPLGIPSVYAAWPPPEADAVAQGSGAELVKD